MKRLVLAASVALAVSTIGIGPAAAGSLEVAPGIATQDEPHPAGHAGDAPEGATGTTESDTDDSAADLGTDGTGTGQGQTGDQGQTGGQDGNESTEPDEPTAPGDVAADPDGDEDDGNDDAGEESEPIDAAFTFEKTEMTTDEIGDPDRGIRYTLDSLTAGDVVTAEPGDDTSTTVENDGTFTGTILGNTELKTGDTLDVTVTVERAGQETVTFSGSVEVVAPDDEDQETSDSELTVSPKTQGLQNFLDTGVAITLTTCVMDEDVDFRVSTRADPDTTVWEQTQTAGEDAAGYAHFIPDGDGGPTWVGEYLVTASCGDRSAETTFTVTEDDSVVEPSLSIEPQKLSGEDFVDPDKGVTMTVTDCEPGSDVQFEVWGHEPSEKLYERTVEAEEDRTAAVQVYGIENIPEAYAGTYQVVADCSDQDLKGDFVVTGSGPDGDSDGSAGGSGDSGESGNAGSMPRTGAELTGLGAGAALILAGAATIVFARRRAQLGS